MTFLKRLTVCPVMTLALLVASCAAPTMPTAPTGNATATESTTPAPAPSPPPPAVAPPTARYRVTFEARWSPSTHPIDIPGSAHFSALVGGTHNSSVAFWREGSPASTGMKDMAERGRTNPLDTEILAAVANGAAERVFTGGAIDKSPGSVSLEFTVSQAFPLVTLVSMVAPSPDWFVGVSGLALFGNGLWVEEVRVDLPPWDAGTDSGTTFFSPDQITSPPSAIARILTAPLSPGGQVSSLGSFTFTRMN